MRYLLTLTLLLSQIGYSNAQSSLSKIYVGIHGFAGNYNIFYPQEVSSRYIASKPVKIDVGFQFTSRFSIQASWINSRQIFQNTGEYVNPVGGKITYSNRDKQANMAFPILLRYTITNKERHKIKFDILGGATIVRAKYHNQATRFNDGQLEYELDQSNKATNFLLTVGPSVRYTIGRHISLVAMGAVNKSLHNGDNKSGVSPTVSAGVNYKFSSN